MSIAGPVRHPGSGLDGGPQHLATLSLRAHQDFLALARISATQVGAMLDLPPARVADLRLAVDEACTSFLYDAARHDPEPFGMSAVPQAMELSYDLYPAELHITVRAAVRAGWPRFGELSWAVLSGLSSEVRVHSRDGLGELTLIEQLPSGLG